MALLVWTQCAPPPDLQLGGEAHYNLLFKWGHFKFIVAKYQTETLGSVKVVPLIMMQGQPVVTVHDMLIFLVACLGFWSHLFCWGLLELVGCMWPGTAQLRLSGFLAQKSPGV